MISQIHPHPEPWNLSTLLPIEKEDSGVNQVGKDLVMGDGPGLSRRPEMKEGVRGEMKGGSRESRKDPGLAA